MIAQVAAAHDATYLPLHEALTTMLRQNPPADPKPYRFRRGRMFDQLHLNDRGATAVAALVASWLAAERVTRR